MKMSAAIGDLLAWLGVGPTRGGLRIAAGIVILALLLVFVSYYVIFREVCELRQRQWGGVWGETSLGDDLGDCSRYKAWYRF